MRRRAGAMVAFLVAASVIMSVLPGSNTGLAEQLLVGRVHATFQPNDGKIFILVLGSDARSGNSDAARADAIHVVGINTDNMKAGILNFPRDAWVDIPGHGTSKINDALYEGGPELVAQTIENLTHIKIDYWVMTGFEGFVGIIHKIGPVQVDVPMDLYDPSGSGADLQAGKQPLHALSALSFVRDRHDFPHGDVDRTTNQGTFLIDLLKKLRGQVAENPATLFKWISATRTHTRFDISPDEMFRLGVLASQLDPKRVDNVTVPVTLGSAGAASVVYIQSSAESIYRRFERDGHL
jgi:polyisoprenyl-teichoic acid--peptidoglycan teichoic acid transferase